MIDKLSQSIKLLIEYKEKVSTAYFGNYNNNNKLEERLVDGPGFLSLRSSFFSYSAQSDQFFDAEEDYILSNNDEDDNESENGSIVVDSEDEERRGL
jgi:hypothetical protein